jgi:hypothetical protein
MNKKTIIIGISSTFAIIAGILAYRYFVPPKFEFMSYTPSAHSGTFVFGNHTEVSFGLEQGNGEVEDRMGWSLEYTSNENETTFNLKKKGVFVKQLAVK